MKFIAALSLLLATASHCAGQTIIDLATADGKYDTLLSLVTGTPGVLDAITANFPVTIFGPTDLAFSNIPEIVASLAGDEAALAQVLASHVVAGVFTAADVVAAGCVELKALSGANLRVMFDGENVMVNESTVIQPDIIGVGGVIHGIDTVILPGSFQKCPSMSSSKKSSTSSTSSTSSKSSKKSSVRA